MSKVTSRRLNAFDLCMCGINDTFRRSGDVGFEAMSVMELDGNIDFDRVQAALVELGQRHPVLTAKLRRSWRGFRWDWENAENLECQQRTCPDASKLQDILLDILNTPRDLTRQPGISFYVINVGTQYDVFVVHVNHVLVDHLSSQLVLRELTRLLNGMTTSETQPVTDLPQQYRMKFSFGRRFKPLLRSVPSLLFPGWTRDSETPRTLESHGRTRSTTQQSVLVRQLSADETTAVIEKARNLARLPSTSMAILASAIRVFSLHTKKKGANDIFRIGLGSEVVQQALDAFHPQNVSTVIRLELRENELDNLEHCVTRLNDQIRMSLKTKSELGLLELISEYRWCYPLVQLVSGRTMRHAFSFWYAYFRVSDDEHEQFAGVPVKKVSFFGPAWHPMGMTLLVSHFRDQIEITLTYLPDLMSTSEAERYCDEVIRELTAPM